MTTAQIALWLTLAAPAPDFHAVPGVAISYAPIVHYWADTFLVPRWLGRSAMREESTNDHRARSRREVIEHGVKVVKVIARGLFQVSVQYQDEHVAKAGLESFNWRNPSDSARVGLAYIARLRAQYDGDLLLTMAGYNAGPGRMRSALPVPLDTLIYLRRIFG